MPFIYLASPYSDPSKLVRHQRYLDARTATALLMKKGLPIFSPIVHCHELAVAHHLPKDFAFWQNDDKAMLAEATSLWVLQLPGWSDSKGVKWEISFANQHHIPVKLITYPLQESQL